MAPRPCKILQHIPTNAPVKLGFPAGPASSDRMLASHWSAASASRRHPLEMQTADAHSQPQRANAPAQRLEFQWCAECIRLDLVREARHCTNMLSHTLVMGNVEVVKFHAVVIADQSRHLLKLRRLKIDRCGSAETMDCCLRATRAWRNRLPSDSQPYNRK